MVSRLFPLGVLCSIIILCSFINSTQSVSCCLDYVRHQKMSCRRLLDYSIQTNKGSCDMPAIIFRSRRGSFLCADPYLGTTHKVRKCIDERRRRAA